MEEIYRDDLYKRALLDFGTDAQLFMVCEEIGELIETIANPLAKSTPIEEGADLTIMLHQLTVLTGHTVKEYQEGTIQTSVQVLTTDLGRLLQAIGHYHRGRIGDKELWTATKRLVIMNMHRENERALVVDRQERLKALLDVQLGKVLKFRPN